VSATGVATLPRVGNAACLDLVNLVEPRAGEVERDHLQAYLDLVAWGETGGIVPADRARRLERCAAEAPDQAEEALRSAVAFREVLDHVFGAIAEDSDPDEADLDELNQTLSALVGRAPLRRGATGFGWAWHETDPTDLLAPVLGPVAESAVDLLRNGPLDRIKACPVDEGGCGWVFLDTTKNRSRRWCSMADCGSVVKSRRHYERHRRAGGRG
jgi:predicted RNA-binding Zn ribbon-like protein